MFRSFPRIMHHLPGFLLELFLVLYLDVKYCSIRILVVGNAHEFRAPNVLLLPSYNTSISAISYFACFHVFLRCAGPHVVRGSQQHFNAIWCVFYTPYMTYVIGLPIAKFNSPPKFWHTFSGMFPIERVIQAAEVASTSQCPKSLCDACCWDPEGNDEAIFWGENRLIKRY